MGARPRLKGKLINDYRKARKADLSAFRCCWHCEHIRYATIHGCDGEFRNKDWRCTITGINNSLRYRVDINHLCDQFTRRQGGVVPQGYEDNITTESRRAGAA